VSLQLQAAWWLPGLELELAPLQRELELAAVCSPCNLQRRPS
jgi:hypothetical protein